MKTKGQQFIKKTALHTFKTTGNYYFKVILVTYEGVEYAISMEFKNDKSYIRVYNASSFNNVSINGKNYVNCELRKALFPAGLCYQHDTQDKRISIPTFKQMRALISDIKTLIEGKNPREKETIELIKNRLIQENLGEF